MSADDTLAVAETLYRYAIGVDTRDWSLYRAQFADRVRLDFSDHFERPVIEMAADDWVAGLKAIFGRLHATHHMMTNPLVDVAGDEAHIRMYVQATHVLYPDDPESIYIVGGYYEDDLVRRGGRWIFTSVKLTVLWSTGNPSILETAGAGGSRN